MPASSVDVARLRECPFCGSSNVDLWRGQIIGNRPDNGMRFARCLNCGASTSCRERADAISSWNTRPEQDRLRVAAEKLHAFVNAKGQEHEEAALGRTNTQSKTYDEESALVCWQVLDEIEALFQGAGDAETAE